VKLYLLLTNLEAVAAGKAPSRAVDLSRPSAAPFMARGTTLSLGFTDLFRYNTKQAHFLMKLLPTSFLTFPSTSKVSRVAQSVQCLATGWMIGRSNFDPRQRRKDFSYSVCVQTSSGAHPASCTMGTGGPFPGAKTRPGRDTDHSPPSSAEVKNEYELYHLSPQAPP
jgi:hypothetical protein